MFVVIALMNVQNTISRFQWSEEVALSNFVVKEKLINKMSMKTLTCSLKKQKTIKRLI